MNVRLRPVVVTDLDAIFTMQLDPESNRLAAVNPRSRAVFDDHWKQALADPRVSARAILLDDRLVGIVSRFPAEGLEMVGYWIDRDCWGRGIGGRALTLLLQEVSERPLRATVAVENLASIRVLEKCGFSRIGTRWSEGDERYRACEEACYELRRVDPPATTH